MAIDYVIRELENCYEYFSNMPGRRAALLIAIEVLKNVKEQNKPK